MTHQPAKMTSSLLSASEQEKQRNESAHAHLVERESRPYGEGRSTLVHDAATRCTRERENVAIRAFEPAKKTVLRNRY